MGANAKRLLGSGSLAELGPGPRVGAPPLAEIDRLFAPVLASVREQRRELTRALVYLWNDHLEEAHAIAQGIEDRDGSYVHGIVHRREPDYSNARYWFHQVGKHPIFAALPARAEDILSGGPGQLRAQLLKTGEWDPFAFIDCCEAAGLGRGDLKSVLEKIQAEEFELLLEHFTD
jgi:hypothetical protein